MAPDRDRGPAMVRAEADNAETRKLVALSIHDLQREITHAVDWRRWICRRPGLAVGLASGLGMMLGRRDK
jgi:hypothetical protein